MRLKGFTLVDVLIGMTLTSLLVILVGIFVRESLQFRAFLHRYQALRAELFPVVQRILPLLIREGVSVDRARTTDHELTLFLDRAKKRSLRVAVEQGQLMLRGPGELIPITSQKVVVEDFTLSWAEGVVRVRLGARAARREGLSDRKAFTFFEDPRISYEALTALRNVTPNARL